MKKILIFLLLFLTSCQSDYVAFHKEKQNQVTTQNEVNNFSFEKINYLSGVTIKSTPDLELLDELTKKIENAKNKVYVEVYIFTEKRLKKSLIKAKKNGVDVKVILEKNIYMAGNLNANTFKDLQNAGIEVVYSNPKNYSLNHTKMMIIDDEVILSTGNYSYSTFKHNKEFFVFIKDKNLIEKLNLVYDADFSGIKKNIYDENLVLSPFYSRNKLEYLLKNAQKSIKMYAHNISDKTILETLIDKKNKNVDIKIILPDLKKVKNNDNEIKLLNDNNLFPKLIDKPEIHAKAILIDEKYLYIGSINFSSPSMDKNREIGILLKNVDIIKKFIDIFKIDFEK